MKQGLHIMLQRLVRSIVRTAPRPYLIEEVPWLWSPSFGMTKSRPGYSVSSRLKNAGSVDITSSKRPCLGHSFFMRIRPSSSTILALISPGLPSTRTFQSTSPDRIFDRTSLTHPGQSESVSRGKPSFGKERSRCFKRGAGAHFGWKDRCGKRRSIARAARHRKSAPLRKPEYSALLIVLRARTISASGSCAGGGPALELNGFYPKAAGSASRRIARSKKGRDRGSLRRR